MVEVDHCSFQVLTLWIEYLGIWEDIGIVTGKTETGSAKNTLWQCNLFTLISDLHGFFSDTKVDTVKKDEEENESEICNRTQMKTIIENIITHLFTGARILAASKMHINTSLGLVTSTAKSCGISMKILVIN